MRAYVHVGMPKAGSTAIQLSMNAQETDLLQNHGIHFGPQDLRFRNDFDIYCACAEGQRDRFRELLTKRREIALESKAEKVIFSCERFFELAEDPTNFSSFVQCFADIFDEQLEFIVVYRDLRSFIKSHATQLIYNGGITYGNLGLSLWIVRLLQAYFDLAFKVTFINFNIARVDSGLYNTFLGLITGEEKRERERYENITPRRSLAYASILGQICKLESVLQNADINSATIDFLRGTINDECDRMLSNGESAVEMNILNHLGGLLEDRITRYADVSIGRLDASAREFVDKLNSARIITNKYLGN